jgi:hypothetical protein
MTFKFKLDRKGGSEVLKSLVADEIHALGEKVAADAGDGVQRSTTTPPTVQVLQCPVPAARQAAHGALTKAASAAGLEVKAK